MHPSWNSSDKVKWRLSAVGIKAHILRLTPDIEQSLGFKPFLRAGFQRHSVRCRAKPGRDDRWPEDLPTRARACVCLCVCVFAFAHACARLDVRYSDSSNRRESCHLADRGLSLSSYHHNADVVPPSTSTPCPTSVYMPESSRFGFLWIPWETV
jgi:hypothetical protein